MKRTLWILILLVLLPPFGPAGAHDPKKRQIAIVAASGFTKKKLAFEEVRAIYLGDLQILGHLRVYPIDQSHNQTIRARFLEQVLGMTRDSYIDYWNRQLFRRGGITPLLSNNSREVLEVIQEQEGAVGYVWADEIKGFKNIRVLLLIDIE